MEWWAGIECTVNRVGDVWHDQLARSGHDRRADDIDRFAALGVRALRYPVLWERHHALPVSGRWDWAEDRLGRIRRLGLRPIVGLVHHGSGPAHTSLVDPRFPGLLADYARAVAERFPWIEEWTPVNEPLTTARFSGLYGHWYPHGRDERAFTAALLHQCAAVQAAMAAIRAVNPRARLVQTEDLGRTWSTPELAAQADFENERRWLSFDLLCGRVVPGHPFRERLLDHGADRALLDRLAAEPCPPDVLGINHYVTSERWLDHRIGRYPADRIGGNGRQRYADVEAVRACALAGPQRLLLEAWERYRLPLAVTEAHLHCTREEQLRWLLEIWRGAQGAARAGATVVAVTAWAGLGSFDWDSLLTRARGSYEPGLFDLRGGAPRPTAAARLVRELATVGESRHPVLAAPGWWRRAVRIEHDAGLDLAHEAVPAGAQPLLVTGARGALGRAVASACALRGLRCLAFGRAELDIADADAVRAALVRWRPWAVVNAAGTAHVDAAERDADRCWRANALGAATLARACAAAGLPLLTFSSDQVFAGDANAPYHEGHAPDPRNVCGRSHAAAEAAALAAHPAALVVRTAALFAADDGRDRLAALARALRAGRAIRVPDGVVVSPTCIGDLVHAALDLLIDGEAGLWHLANQGSVAWVELARTVAGFAGADADLVRPAPPPAHLPRFTALTSGRGLLLRPLPAALDGWRSAILPGLLAARGAAA